MHLATNKAGETKPSSYQLISWGVEFQKRFRMYVSTFAVTEIAITAVAGLGADFGFCLVFPSYDAGVVPLPCRTLILALTGQNQRPARLGTKNCSIFSEIWSKIEKSNF